MLADADAIVRAEFITHVNPTKSCHAATIVDIGGGNVVAAWFGGTAESAPDVGIWLARFTSGSWSAPVEVARATDGDSCYNPVLFHMASGELLLFYKFGRGPSTWHGALKRSADGGKHWGQSELLPACIFGPIKNPPMLRSDGTLICPSSTEDSGWRVHFEFTSDAGRTWSKTEPVNDPQHIGAIQPSLLRLEGRRLRAIGRTRQGRLFAIDSPDDGATWGPMRLLDLPNPNSGTDALRLKDGRFLLVYNRSKTARSPLNVAISSDAEHWRDVLTLENQPGEFSYPTVVQAGDGKVHVVFTWNRVRIRHVVIDPARLK